MLIRGHKSAEYHIDAATPTLRKLRRCGLCATVTGGGRIKHDESRRSILVYGYVPSLIKRRESFVAVDDSLDAFGFRGTVQ